MEDWVKGGREKEEEIRGVAYTNCPELLLECNTVKSVQRVYSHYFDVM